MSSLGSRPFVADFIRKKTCLHFQFRKESYYPQKLKSVLIPLLIKDQGASSEPQSQNPKVSLPTFWNSVRPHAGNQEENHENHMESTTTARIHTGKNIPHRVSHPSHRRRHFEKTMLQSKRPLCLTDGL